MNSFLEDVCRPFLLHAQNPDGGWGYRTNSASSTEPTCWTLLALAGTPPRDDVRQALVRGCEWLTGAQCRDGAWPATQGQPIGSWVTSLACIALSELGTSPQALARGVAWLCRAWPAEGNFWWRIRRWAFREKGTVRQNDSLRGWSWTPGTSSWVEPTSYALILLRNLPTPLQSRRASRRRELAQAMLYDRMCPGGGWNCGNPLVYGVAGEPQVGPTVWALLALQDHDHRPEIESSLTWLEQCYEGISGPASLALAHLCLACYGRSTPPLESPLERFYQREQFLGSVVVMAWVATALGPVPGWVQSTLQKEQR